MKNNKKTGLILFSLLVFSLFSMGISFNAPMADKSTINGITPIAAADQIILYKDNVDVSGSAQIYRGLESLNITYQSDTQWSGDVNANITFSDDSSQLVLLDNIINGTTKQWSAIFTPTITNITGNAVIEIKGITTSALILNNLPKAVVQMNVTDEVFRGSSIGFTVTPSDIEDSSSSLEWQVALYKSGDIMIDLIQRGEQVFEGSFDFPLNYTTGAYYINATCWDNDTLSGNGNSILYDLTLKDNEPIIELVQFTLNDEIQNSNDMIGILRDAPILLTLNVSDIDTDTDDLSMTITAKDPILTTNNLFFGDYSNLSPVNGTFSKNITFPASTNLGLVNLNIKIFEVDSPEIFVEYVQSFEIQNNIPEISKFLINGQGAGDQIEVKQGEWLNFTFDVSDVENSISYLTISLYYIDQVTGNTEIFNYTTTYDGSSTVLRVRAIDLPVGSFTAYVYVIDIDGAQSVSAPYSFEIQKGDTQEWMNWLMFVIGIVLGGVIIGIGMYTSTKHRTPIETTPEKPVKSTKKAKNMAPSDKKVVKTEEKEDKPVKESEKPPKSTKKSKKKPIRRL